RSVVRRYCDACIETSRRKRRGERARYPRRRRRLFPLRWYYGTFGVDGRRVRLGVARGCGELWVRMARDLPYAPETVRSVTLVVDSGRVCLDVTALVPVAERAFTANEIAGVDMGIIHPFALACDDEALLISGRAIRAEER